MTSRKLRLRSETLGELTSDELRRVIGATHAGCPTHGGTSCDSCVTLPVNDCLDRLTGPAQTAIEITSN